MDTGKGKDKRREKEIQKMKRLLQSYPDPYDVDGRLRPEITANKLTYIFLKHSERLNKLTTALIVLTAILAAATIVAFIMQT